MDIFGHVLPATMPCTKVMTDPDDPSVTVNMNYNASGLLTKWVYRLSGVGADSISFTYDGQNRLTFIDDFDGYQLTYGSDNKLASFIAGSQDPW